MKKPFLLISLISILTVKVTAQNQFPNLDPNALVSARYDLTALNKPYTVIIYGGVGCGFSQYLIQNLELLSACSTKCDIVLIMDQPKDSITKHMQEVIDRYPTFTNTVLQYRLRKKNDFFPQLLLFRDKVQIEHIVGLKEGMLTNTRKRILEGD